MKILIFCPYYPPHIGGLETHADEFNKYISPYAEKIVVFTPRLPDNSDKKETGFKNVETIRFPAFEIIPNYPLPKFWYWEFWKLFRGLFRENFDIVISRTRFFNTSLMALAFSKLKKIKWIHIEHGSDFVKLDNKITSLIAKLYDYTFGRLVLGLSDKNIANSIASANFCQKLIPQRHCEVIYRGVEIEKIINIQPALNIKNKYPNDIIITYIGRLIDGKGVADLIKVISKIKSENIKCFIIGDGPQKENLIKLSKKLNISDKIIFWGYKKHEEAIGILKISDIFVNPSYNEGLPSSVIEAALCRKAIIATNVGGTTEIFTDNKSGFLIEPRNINLLKGKIDLFIKEKQLREKMGENAFLEVMDKFNWDKNIKKYLEIINNIKKDSEKRKKIYILSSRHGGPYKQHKIIAEELRKNGFWVDHRSNLWGWIKLHFIYGSDIKIITNVPLLFRLSKKNFILNIKGNYHREKSITKNPLGYFYGLNQLWSEEIVLPSNYLKEVLNIKNAVIIPNAVSENLIQAGLKEKKENNNDNVSLIMVTMFGFREKSEGVLKVIKALSEVTVDRKINLNIFGKGIFENEIKKRASRIKMPDNIKVNFCGYAKNINEEYQKADIFVYWSDLDVMPNVFLEAMAFGLPIITNDFPSFKEIIGENNLIVKNKNDFVLGLQEILKNDRKKYFISKNNQKIARGMSFEEKIDRWTSIF